MALTCTQIWWTTEVGMAFARLEEGYESAMKDYHKKQVAQLKTLISMLIGPLSKGDRQKIMTICTIDVHARDVVAKMITQKVSPNHSWVSLFVGTQILGLGRSSYMVKTGQRAGKRSWCLLQPFKTPMKAVQSQQLMLSGLRKALCAILLTGRPCPSLSEPCMSWGRSTCYLLHTVFYPPALPLCL